MAYQKYFSVSDSNFCNSYVGIKTDVTSAQILSSEKGVKKLNKSKGYSVEDIKQMSEIFYAGAKFCEHPDPLLLPKPPKHWINGATNKKLAC